MEVWLLFVWLQRPDMAEQCVTWEHLNQMVEVKVSTQLNNIKTFSILLSTFLPSCLNSSLCSSPSISLSLISTVMFGAPANVIV